MIKVFIVLRLIIKYMKLLYIMLKSWKKNIKVKVYFSNDVFY